jgi:hypothetical protein
LKFQKNGRGSKENAEKKCRFLPQVQKFVHPPLMPFLSAFCKNNENEAEIFSEPCRDHGRSSLKNWAEKVQMMEFWKPNDVFSRGVNELLLATVVYNNDFNICFIA